MTEYRWREGSSFERARVVVRFREGVRLSGRPDTGDEIERAGIGPWASLTNEFPGLVLSPVFGPAVEDQLSSLQARAAELDPTYRAPDFGAFFYIDAPPETDLVALLKSLLAWNSVEEAYIDQGAPDPVVNAANDPRPRTRATWIPRPMASTLNTLGRLRAVTAPDNDFRSTWSRVGR